MVMIFWFLILGSIVASYLYMTRNYNYWRDRKIPYAKGALPGFGNTLPLLFLRISLFDLLKRFCYDHQDRSMVGFYHQTTPALLIREPELVKTILQTNFASFSKNLWKVDPHLERLQTVNPFFAYDNTWLIARKHLGVAFTSSRLRIFFNCIEHVCKELEDFLNNSLKENNNVIELELNSLAIKYTTFLAAYLSFSVENVRLEGESGSLSLVKIAESMLGPHFTSLLRQTLHFYFFDLKRIFGISFVPPKVDHFFSGIVNEMKHIRKQDKSARKYDFLQLMLDLNETNELDDNMVAAHVFTFFINVHETSSISLGFAGYQIARHRHVQQKLRDEVKTVLARYDGQLTYEALKEMTYMEQVMNESQRLYPTVPNLAKICTEEFELKGSDGLSCRIHPGTEIFVNTFELHRNPKYWSNPDVFDPDRFAPDKKTEIEKFAFLPFSEGPRICIAMRLALLQTKAYLATIIRNYTLELSSKTPQEPFKIMPGKFLTTPVDGLWIYLKPL